MIGKIVGYICAVWYGLGHTWQEENKRANEQRRIYRMWQKKSKEHYLLYWTVIFLMMVIGSLTNSTPVLILTGALATYIVMYWLDERKKLKRKAKKKLKKENREYARRKAAEKNE